MNNIKETLVDLLYNDEAHTIGGTPSDIVDYILNNLNNILKGTEWVKLPFKVGDMVYYVSDANNLIPIAEGVITDIKIDFNSINPVLIDVDCGKRYVNFNDDKNCLLGFTCHLKDINRYWFLTREKAEQRAIELNCERGSTYYCKIDSKTLR